MKKRRNDSRIDRESGLRRGSDCLLALDPAASEFYDGKKYVFKKSDKRKLTSEEMVAYWKSWCDQYPIISIEDGMAENDWTGWKPRLTSSATEFNSSATIYS